MENDLLVLTNTLRTIKALILAKKHWQKLFDKAIAIAAVQEQELLCHRQAEAGFEIAKIVEEIATETLKKADENKIIRPNFGAKK